MTVVIAVSRRDGQVTLSVSARTSCRNLNGLIFAITFLVYRVDTSAGADVVSTATARATLSAVRYRTDHAWQEWRDSNPQPPVLETGALAIELHSSGSGCGGPEVRRPAVMHYTPPYFKSGANSAPSYSMIWATTPAPTVRPPSRMAKRSFSSIAMGTISSTVIEMLSPGITISVPSGRCTTPVTSVVRK